MIEKILPPPVAVAEAFTDPVQATVLPAEEPVIRRSVDKRRREFTTVRWCARRALADLGVPPSPILPGERGAPTWPEGIVGSMTHCAGYRSAAVARAAAVRTIGIDAEPHQPLPEGILEAIAVASELRRHRQMGRVIPGVHADRLLFSAKEAVYKAWFPLTRRFLRFEDADITLRPDGTFTAQILAEVTPYGGLEHGFTGRWLAANELLITAIAEPCARRLQEPAQWL